MGKDLDDWLKSVALPYHSPHKFRHRNAVYSLKNARGIAALKAISQNLMHKNLTITDRVYGALSKSDLRKQVALLSQTTESNQPDVIEFIVDKILKQLQKQ